MTIKISELTTFLDFYTKIKNEKLSFKTAYRLTLLATEIEKHVQYYQEAFRNLLLTYCQRDENGNPKATEDGQGVLLIEDKITEAYEKITELQALEAELPDFKFSPDDFNEVSLAPNELLPLLPFITE